MQYLLIISYLLLIVVFATGCNVKLQAPEKPITINLNVKVEQDIHLTADEDLNQLIQENPDVF